MKVTWTPKTDVKPGDRTVLGIVTETKLSPSGKTLVITVDSGNGSAPFTDRIPAAGNMAVFTEEA